MSDRRRAAAQVALEALINGKNVRAGDGGTKHQTPLEDAAIEQLRAALDEPEVEDVFEQEPVAWMDDDGHLEWNRKSWMDDRYFPVYRYPPRREWQGLTDEELSAAWASSKGDVLFRLLPFARAIEAALKEKNYP